MSMRSFHLIVASLLLSFSNPAVLYASIEIVPAIGGSHYWTNNRSLAVDELREEDTITEIRPEIALTMESRRHRGVLDASYQHLTYHQANETRSFQQYRASTNSELTPGLFYLDLSADKIQTAISPQAVVGTNNLSLTTNRTDVQTSTVHPYLLKQWNPRWQSRVDYSYRDNSFESNQLTDSQVQEFTVMTRYGATDDEIQVTLSYDGVRSESDNVALPAEFDEIRLDTRYQMNKYWAWLLNAGYEEDRYQASTIEKTEGGFGEVGAEIVPTSKIVIYGTVGERYFGDTASLRIQYQYNSRTGGDIGYRKDVTQNAIELNRIIGAQSQFGVLFDPVLLTEVFEIKRSDARLYYEWAKSRGELSGYHEIRDFQLTQNQEIIDYIEAVWAWSITAKSRLDLEISMQERESENLSGKDRLNYALMRIETNPMRQVSMGGEYSQSRRTVDFAQSYREQQVGIFVRVLFGGNVE